MYHYYVLCYLPQREAPCVYIFFGTVEGASAKHPSEKHFFPLCRMTITIKFYRRDPLENVEMAVSFYCGFIFCEQILIFICPGVTLLVISGKDGQKLIRKFLKCLVFFSSLS